jgi:hypothetical protein
VRHIRSVRLATASALVISAAAMTLSFAGPAAAVTAKIKCSHLNGNVTGTITASGCTGVPTGGGSKPIAATALASGGTVTWLNNKTTTIDKPTLTGETDTGEHAGTTGCPTGTSETEASGHVTADTTGLSPVPGKYKAEVCVDGSNNITLEPGSKLKLT